MSKYDVTVVIIFHAEKYYARPALDSLLDMIRFAVFSDLKVEAIAVLDKADVLTKSIIYSYEDSLDKIIEVDVGDLGLSRNAAVNVSSGEYIAFLDGDDLWGEEWLVRSCKHIKEASDENNSILHPEYLLYFDELDFECSSINSYPHANAKSFWFRHISNRHPRFDPRNLLLNNVWSANSFASKDVYIKYPYYAVDRLKGFGVEDWAWNLETTWNELDHLIVPDTVHIIRVKQFGSLGRQNQQEGLLLPLPNSFDIDKWS